MFYWATIEHELVDIIGEAMCIGKKERRILMAKTDPKAKLAMLKVIGSKYVKNPRVRTKINQLAAAGIALYAARNLFAHGAWVHPHDDPSVYELLVIDSGEAAYLPKRMSAKEHGRASFVAHFANATKVARQILGMVQAEAKERSNSDSSVTSGPERTAPLVVPDNPANRQD